MKKIIQYFKNFLYFFIFNFNIRIKSKESNKSFKFDTKKEVEEEDYGQEKMESVNNHIFEEDQKNQEIFEEEHKTSVLRKSLRHDIKFFFIYN